MTKKEFSTKIGGKKITAEFGDLASKANGSVLLSSENTMVFATVVMAKEESGSPFFPLMVDYEEKFYAAGKILGSRFTRREGRPSEEAVLNARAIDRTLRPLFDHSIRHEIQVVVSVLSIGEEDPDVLAINAASLALLTSDIPWNGPVSAVRICKSKEEFLINPRLEEKRGGEMEIVACGKDKKINMIEMGAQEVSEDTVTESLKLAQAEIEKLQKFQKSIEKEIGKEKKVLEKKGLFEEAKNLFDKEIEEKIQEAVFDKESGKEKIQKLEALWIEKLEQSLEKEIFEQQRSTAIAYFEEKIQNALHKGALERNERADGRGMDEIRHLYAQAGGVSPLLHGSGIFYRGETHVLSVLTLGSPRDSQLMDGIEVEKEKRFIHHYNFPPFSSGETGRLGGFNRRAIGHGALAEKALQPLIPEKSLFPYTIRIVSESMSSNGSTSMASVCAASLSLLDAGVPNVRPVAGIALGLMMAEKKEEYKILTDIQGPEDEYGDMDFKVAGTRKGITAIQMDVKVLGVCPSILQEVLQRAQVARFKILDVMEKEISNPRPSLSPHAPEIITIKIDPEKIGAVIGPGGKVIDEIRQETETEVEIEEDGTVFITGKQGGGEKARTMIESIARVYKVGERFQGEVIKILEFGAFVKINGNTEGLVHISELAPFRINDIHAILKEHSKVPVVIKEIDDKNRIKLSIKQADPNFFKKEN